MLTLWSHLDADDAEALGAAFDACRSRSLEAPIKPPQLKTGDGCTFAPLTPVHIELRQNEVNWYNRVFGWLPFVDSANDIRRENRRLQKRIEDIRLVDRAKCLLIECCGMSEPAAHSYIERQAMNRRCPKRDIAQGIIDGDAP